MRLRSVLALLIALQLVGCSVSLRPPTLLARGEIAVTVDPGLALTAGGQQMAHSPTFRQLPDYVSCTEPAYSLARDARRAGRRGRALSILGVVFGFGAMVGFGAIADRDHAGAYLLGAVGSGFTGLGFAIAGYRSKRAAYGFAVDAANSYNDAVGSLGATCSDLEFAQPSGPLSFVPRLEPLALRPPTLEPSRGTPAIAF